MTKLSIQQEELSPYPYSISVPEEGTMYFRNKKEALAFIDFYNKRMNK